MSCGRWSRSQGPRVPPGKPGGVNIAGTVGFVGGDIVGGDKIGLSAEELVAVLETRGVLQTAETAGLQRRTIITLAQHATANGLRRKRASAVPSNWNLTAR